MQEGSSDLSDVHLKVAGISARPKTEVALYHVRPRPALLNSNYEDRSVGISTDFVKLEVNAGLNSGADPLLKLELMGVVKPLEPQDRDWSPRSIAGRVHFLFNSEDKISAPGVRKGRDILEETCAPVTPYRKLALVVQFVIF